MARSIIEGHLLNLYNGFQSLPVVPEKIYLTGGLSQSPAWCQTIADIFSAKTTPIIGEGAALGAAIHACWVWKNENGKNTKIEDLCDGFVKVNNSLSKTPRKEYVPVYDRLKKLYKSLSSRIQGNEGDDPFILHTALKR